MQWLLNEKVNLQSRREAMVQTGEGDEQRNATQVSTVESRSCANIGLNVAEAT